MKGNVYWRGGNPIVRFKGVYKRCQSLKEAEEILTGLRFKDYEGTFDLRDYKKDQPLGFENLAMQWLEVKKDEGLRCWRNKRLHIGKAINFFANQNVKAITYGELEDFLRSLPKNLSSKYKADILSTLHTFFIWICKRDRAIEMPDFPTVKYELGWRNTVDKETQTSIIEEVKRISYDINPKIWIGIKWLSTYVSIRPIELLHIKEGDIDLSLGIVNVRWNKERRPKIVPFLDEDIELIRGFRSPSGPAPLPNLNFFRHEKRKGVHRDKRGQFSRNYLWSWWKRACGNLGIQKVDLYGGTKHSSVKALREHFSPDQIKKYGTMHHTNKAFDRYLQFELEDSRAIYGATRPAQLLPKVIGQKLEGKVLKLGK